MTTPPPARRLPVTVGHGTENDFVLVDDRDGVLDLTPELVRALADRHAGVGGDGVIRLAPTAAVADAPDLGPEAPLLFMDYRNADGTAAEMCGNGVRVVARFAEDVGAWDGTGELVLGTRAGIRRVRRVADPLGGTEPWYAVDMGPLSLLGGALDAEVVVAGLPVARPAASVDVGNPHTVLAVADADELEVADLTRAPVVTPTPPRGTNVELVVPLGEDRLPDGTPVGRLRLRVHERGVGETRSCGTGACAAALAVRTWGGAEAPSTWLVDVPGGTVRVVLADGRAELAGPAVLVLRGEVDLAALRLTPSVR